MGSLCFFKRRLLSIFSNALKKMILKGKNSTKNSLYPDSPKSTIWVIFALSFIHLSPSPPPPSSPLSTVLFLNFLSLDYRLDPLVLHSLFLKSKDILSRNHHIVIKFRTLTIAYILILSIVSTKVFIATFFPGPGSHLPFSCPVPGL